MSLHAKTESAGGINFCLQRHGGAGEPGQWPPLNPIPATAMGV